MRRFDLLDEYAMVILPMRHRDVPRHASEERQPDDICMDMAILAAAWDARPPWIDAGTLVPIA